MIKSYLKFEEVPFKGKTKRFNIISKNHGDILGRISWYPQWRQYTFSPSFETIWNINCLEEINIFIKKLMDERKNKLKDIQRISNWED